MTVRARTVQVEIGYSLFSLQFVLFDGTLKVPNNDDSTCEDCAGGEWVFFVSYSLFCFQQYA